jgi:hypothetical protein
MDFHGIIPNNVETDKFIVDSKFSVSYYCLETVKIV